MATLTLGPLSEFPLDQPTRVQRDGDTYVVVRDSSNPDAACVVSDRCPHLGLSLTKGPRKTVYADGVITCPFHNSAFDVCSGENRDWTPGVVGIRVPAWSRKAIAMGRKPAPLTTFPSSVVDGDVTIEI